MTDNTWLWVGFNAFILFMLALDLGVFHRKSHDVTFKESITWTCVWIALAMAFNALVWKWFGQAKALEFFDLLTDISFRHVIDIRDAQTLYLDAMELGCGSYDGAYVRAAPDNDAQLATLDKKLIPHLVTNGVKRWV